MIKSVLEMALFCLFSSTSSEMYFIRYFLSIGQDLYSPVQLQMDKILGLSHSSVSKLDRLVELPSFP